MKKTSKVIFATISGVAIVLVIAGFIVPPLGVIDGSVLTALGELLGFALLAELPLIIQKGSDITLSHGQTTITIDNPDTEEPTQ